MRIVYIAAGAGGMYCGACARDVNLVRGLMARGHDVEVIPLYTPLRLDGDAELNTSAIFFGGINVFLQQASPIFRHTPELVDRVFDSPSLLTWASRFAIKTRAEELGPMTVSVLSGRHGRQRKEFAKLLNYLESTAHPDVVNLTNSLLSGIAPELKSRLNVPVVCTLQGEDGFVGVMPEPHRSAAQELMRENARAIDLFISPGEHYADRMAVFLDVSADRIRVIHAGIDTGVFRNPGARHREPFTIGYLSAITPGKGLDILAAAFVTLAKRQKRDVVLRAAGRVLDRDFWRAVTRSIAHEGLEARFEHLGEVDLAGKLAFLRGCSVFSVPSRIEECRGMAAMEAMACGVPVVVPNSGVFPELVGLTEGGLLFPSGDADALAEGIARIMDDPRSADEAGHRAAAGIGQHYSAAQMTERVLAEYSALGRE